MRKPLQEPTMKSTDLAKLLSPFKRLVDIRAIDPVYRTLELTADKIYGQSLYAQLDVSAEIGVDKPCFVDGNTFVSVVESMPADTDMTFKVTQNALEWKCGNASGKLAQLQSVIINKNSIRRSKTAWKINGSFIGSLSRGSISCDKTMAPANLYGVVVSNEHGVVASSDGTTVAWSSFVRDHIDGPASVTLSQAATELLVSAISEEGSADYTDRGITYRDKSTNLLVAVNDPLAHDIISKANDYPPEGSFITEIPRGLITSFVRRAAAMAEIKQHTYVTLSADKGRVSLSFAEGAASTDEYYMMAESKKMKSSMPPIKLDAMRMARALSYSDHMVLDYLTDNILVLASKDKSFRYVIAGRTE
jgi:hypothetical protein